jgi:hypothetical protein
VFSQVETSQAARDRSQVRGLRTGGGLATEVWNLKKGTGKSYGGMLWVNYGPGVNTGSLRGGHEFDRRVRSGLRVGPGDAHTSHQCQEERVDTPRV